MNWRERLQTIMVTATLISFAWIMAGFYVLLHWSPPETPFGNYAYNAGVPAQSAHPPSLQPPGPGSPRMTSPIALAPVFGHLILPVGGVQSGQLIDTFTHARANGVRRHDAIDIMAPLGTPVLAAASGRLEKLHLSRDGGNTIYIRSPDRRTIYYYAHLDHYALGISEGQVISAGQVIGAVGFSGNANPAAPHLHFAINVLDPAENWSKGTPVNPYPLLMLR